MKALVRLYPKAWRERYGEEFAAVLAGQKATVGMIVDVLGGALDAHLYPQVHVRPTEAKGDEMTTGMLNRCASGGPTISKRQMTLGSVAIALVYIAMTYVYVVLRRAYHAAPPVEAYGYTLFPVMTLVYLQMGYLRRRSVAAQVLFVLGFAVIIYLAMWAAFAVSGTIGHHGAA
jgi:hypothetical protein